MRSAFRAALVAAALLVSSRAGAEEGPLRLTWFAPVGCPTAEEVKATALKGVDPSALAANGGVPLEADAHVEQRTPSSWRVFLKTRRGAAVGEREIEAATCAGVADATAVVLALALVPPGSAPVSPPAASTPPAPPLVPSPAPPPGTAPTPVSPSVESTGPHHVAVGVAVVADFGTMPKPAIGGAVHVAWRPSRLWVEAMGRFLGGQTENVPNRSAGADFSLVGVGGRGCFSLVQLDSFEASPCVGGGVEIVAAEGHNADTNLQPTKAWVNLAYGVVGRYEVARWLAVRAGVEGTSPLYRPNFVVEGTGSVHRPSSIGAGAYFGAEVLFL